MIDELVGSLRRDDDLDVSLSYDQRTDIEHAIDQCIYCLFGHPSKRGKVKHLEEHNSTQVSINVACRRWIRLWIIL